MFQDENQDSQNNFNEKNSENDACKKEVQSLKDSLIRLNADFDNYKKRIQKEKTSWLESCASDIFLDLLPIIDDFDRAFSNYKKGENKEADKWVEGFELIHKAFTKFLDNHGVKEIKDFTTFNPEFHEAIAQVESSDHKSGRIVAVVQKGYFLKDKVLRPVQVTVAK